VLISLLSGCADDLAQGSGSAGKADSASADPHDAECIEAAAQMAESFVLRNWDFDRIESAEILDRDGDAMTIDLVALDGGHDDGLFRVEMSSGCKALSIEEIKFFTPSDLPPDPPPPVDLARCQAESDLAVEAFILADWDFDFIQSHDLDEVRPTYITMDVVAIDGGHDEGSFSVQLDRLCNVKRVEQTGFFTP
jgi:hypothetical protein